jgi:putative hydrolases of HD superfamily
MNNETIPKILEFMLYAEKLKSTMRHNWMRSGRQESSAEHTWRATLLAIICLEYAGVELNFEKLIKMLVIHDLAESVDGDVPGWDKNDRENRKRKEKENSKLMFGTLPKKLSDEYYNLFIEFEEGESIEAKYGQAIEKIESQLQHGESGPKFWNEEEKGEHMLTYPNKAIAKLDSQFVKDLWDEIKKRIEGLM